MKVAISGVAKDWSKDAVLIYVGLQEVSSDRVSRFMEGEQRKERKRRKREKRRKN